jgi:hypothetical protein
MATPYADIYNSFLDKTTDSDFMKYSETNRETLMLNYMKRACAKFADICKKNLFDRNETTKQFNITLTDEEIDIISDGMIVEWLRPKYLYNENMKNVLNGKDYKIAASPANVLKEIRESYLQVENNFKSRMNRYSFMNSDINTWSANNTNIEELI